MPDDLFPEPVRRASARTLSVLLAILALTLAASAALIVKGLAPGALAAGQVPGIALAEGALALLAAIAAGLEWTRARMAEAFALPASALAFLGAPVLVVWSYWTLGVLQGVVALACALALARRYMVRDELRHRPRVV